MNNSFFVRYLVLALCLAASLSAKATSIQVRQECGFGYVECGPPLFVLAKNGSAVNYQVDEQGKSIFSLAYIGNDFVMTALQPNTVATDGALPYGLDIYWGDGPLIQKWDCTPPTDPACQGGTAIEFISWMSFPTDPAVPTIVHIPTVPEPDLSMLALVGFGVVAYRLGSEKWKANQLQRRLI
ncbi:MAG: hypothetical protein EOP36_04625 [Rubrivivax sp.]|nr:MAG: hypothetical protein EOP36_04625 [Rubrivivax sp.]